MPKAVQVSTCLFLSLAMLSAFPAPAPVPGLGDAPKSALRTCLHRLGMWAPGRSPCKTPEPGALWKPRVIRGWQKAKWACNVVTVAAVPVSAAAEELMCLVGGFVHPKGCRRLEESVFYPLWGAESHLPAKGPFLVQKGAACLPQGAAGAVGLHPRARRLCLHTEPFWLWRELCDAL